MQPRWPTATRGANSSGAGPMTRARCSTRHGSTTPRSPAVACACSCAAERGRMAVPSPDPVGDFIDACVADAAQAKALAAADPSLLRAERLGDPLLHWMAIEDFAAGLTTLLDLGVPADLPDTNGVTALQQAAR